MVRRSRPTSCRAWNPCVGHSFGALVVCPGSVAIKGCIPPIPALAHPRHSRPAVCVVAASLLCCSSCQLLLERTSGDVSALCVAKFQVFTTGKWPLFPSVLVASDFAALRAQHLQLTGPVGQTSWADSVGMFRQRHRDVAASIAAALTNPPTHVYHLQGAAASKGFLHSVGFETAEWAALADGLRPRQPVFSDIARAIEEHFVSSSILPRLFPTKSLPLNVLSPDRWRVSLSRWCFPPLSLGSVPNSSTFSSFVACGFPSPLF